MSRRPIHEGLFTGPPEPRLLAGRCADCQALHFPSSAFCPYCSAEAISAEPVGERGTIYLHTVVNNAPPGYRGPTPYGFGLVDLEEGLRVVTRLSARNLDTLRSGIPVRLEIAPLFLDDEGNEVLSWAYAPSDEAGE